MSERVLKNYIPCEKCKVSPNPGYLTKEDGTVLECNCLKNYNNYIRLVKYLKSVGVPTRYIDYSISDYEGEKSLDSVNKVKNLIPNIEDFVEKGLQLYLVGPEFTQKAAISCYIMKKAIMKKKSAYYTTMPNLVHLLKNAYFAKAITAIEATKELALVKNVDLLVVDDAFDSKKVYLGSSSAIQSLLIDFFKHRNNNLKSNVYVSEVKVRDIDLTGTGNAVGFGSFFQGYLQDECVELEFEDVLSRRSRNKQIASLLK